MDEKDILTRIHALVEEVMDALGSLPAAPLLRGGGPRGHCR